MKDHLYVYPDDIRAVIFAAFAGLAKVMEPESLSQVTQFMRRFADLPTRTPTAAEAIRDLADALDGKEPEQEPAPPVRPSLRIVS